MEPDGSAPRPTAARRTLALAALILAPLTLGPILVSAGPAAGQTEPGEPAPSEPAPSEPAPTTEPPPTTIVLDDGDFGVVPPGGTAPGDPGVEPPPEEPPPADGELAVPEELPVVILPDPTPGLNAALAAIDVTAAEARVAQAALPLLAAGVQTTAAWAARDGALQTRRAAVEWAVEARSRLEALAVNVVMFGDPAGLEPITGPPSLADLRDRELRDVTTAHVQETFDAAVVDLRSALEGEAAATTALRGARRDEHRAERRYLTARTDLERATAAARDARRQLGPSILGPTVLETADLVAWYRTYYPADPPVAPITSIIDAYLRVGAEEGVTGDIAFAQAVLETGGFGSDKARAFNFAGIGAYDSCAPTCGFRFPDLDSGVRAHIHLLRAYADPSLTSAQLASTPDRRVAPERVGVRGCCPRWTSLTGVWATDPNYDRKVLGIYRLMVETARSLDRGQT